MAIAQAIAAGAKALENEFDDRTLLKNTDLQRSLLKENSTLRQRFEQALREKPESISIVQFSQQFWATRIHLLREHAVARKQSQGGTNVLSTLKPKIVDGVLRLPMTKEQIQLIFKQHPLMRRAYNENVPPLKDSDFWGKFFQSRLLKKLKGEKIDFSTMASDPVFDRYLNVDDFFDRSKSLDEAHFSKFIDLEGNEQNHSQRKGNAPDNTMKPRGVDKVPILRILNSMSENLMAQVSAADSTPHGHAPAGMDEETFEQLRLRDLQKDDLDNRVMLNVKETQFHGLNQQQKSAEAVLYAKQNPAAVLSRLTRLSKEMSQANTASSGLHLETAIGVLEKEESSDEEGQPAKKKAKIGSRVSRNASTKQIMKAIRQRRSQTDDFTSSSGTFGSVPMSKTALLNVDTFEMLVMTHNTTVEFLHYFWTVFYSGDPERASEAQKLVETLEKSLDRIRVVAEKAEEEKKADVKKAQEQAQMDKQKQRRRKEAPQISGGAKAVNEMMGPTIRAIKTAKERYQTAYREEMKMAAQLQAAQ